MSEEQNTDPRAPAQPMTPEALVNLREGLAWNSSDVPVPHDLVCQLLADRDYLAAEVKRLTDRLDAMTGVVRGSTSASGAGS